MSTVPDKLYYRIGEVETITEIPAYVLRYWESEFKLLRPKKNPAGQRLYRKADLDLVLRIKTLLYEERESELVSRKHELFDGVGRALTVYNTDSSALYDLNSFIR